MSGYYKPRPSNNYGGNQCRPGYKTTEFWLTLGTFIVSGFVLIGIIPQYENDYTGAVVGHVIESIALITAQAGIVYKYISSRQNEKSSHRKTTKVDEESSNKLPQNPYTTKTTRKKTSSGTRQTTRRNRRSN